MQFSPCANGTSFEGIKGDPAEKGTDPNTLQLPTLLRTLEPEGDLEGAEGGGDPATMLLPALPRTLEGDLEAAVLPAEGGGDPATMLPPASPRTLEGDRARTTGLGDPSPVLLRAGDAAVLPALAALHLA